MDWVSFWRVALVLVSAGWLATFLGARRARRKSKEPNALADADADTLRELRADLGLDDDGSDTVVSDASELLAKLREQR
jgi:hypothetical protein